MKDHQVGNNIRSSGTSPDEQEKTPVGKPIFSKLDQTNKTSTSPRNIDLIMDIPLELNVVLGESTKSIKEVLSFTTGSVLQLNKSADQPLDIYINGKRIGYGEVVVVNENFGVRVTNILSQEQRLKKL